MASSIFVTLLAVMASVGVMAAPASGTQADLSVPTFDLDLVSAAPAVPNEIDLTIDQPAYSYNFLGNTSWSVMSRPTGLFWIHESRFGQIAKELLAERRLLRRGAETVEERGRAKTWRVGWTTSSSGCPGGLSYTSDGCYGGPLSTRVNYVTDLSDNNDNYIPK
ncbi:hypothetical protein IFR05_008073, partial [Cadophora sp. M221]